MERVNLTLPEQLDYFTREAFNTLRTNIQLSGANIKTIMLTSCTPNEGKSTISMNLAMSIAELGKSVILIDADLRKSVLAGRCRGAKIEKGLSHYLSGQNSIHESIQKTSINNMDIIFAGPVPPSPCALLEGDYFKILLANLREVYDYVIIDAPPLGSVIDAAVIGKECDGTLLVIEASRISYKFVQKVADQLIQSNCNIMGTVLNKVDLNSKSNYFNKYYGKYYGHE